jgi:hypothetical protein
MKLSKIIVSIPILVIIFLSPPFVFNKSFDVEYYKEIIVVFSLITTFFIIRSKPYKKDNNIVVFLIISILYSMLSIISHVDSFGKLDYKYINISIQFFVTLVTYLYIMKYYGMINFCKLFIIITIIISIFTIASFFLILYGYLTPFKTFTNPDGRVAYDYLIQYTNTIQYSQEGSLIRPAGFFDEPGTLAFVIINALFINFLVVRSKIAECILIFAGILTSSLAFYILLSLYFLIVKNINIKTVIFIILIVILLYFIINYNIENILFQNIYDITFGRFHLNPDINNGLVVGDNRTAELKAVINIFVNNPIIGSGFLEENTKTDISGFDSVLELGHPLIFHGILGYLIYSLIPLYAVKTAFKFKSSKMIGIIFIVFINYIQRPSFFGSGLYGLMPIMLIYGFFYFNKITNENTDNWR